VKKWLVIVGLAVAFILGYFLSQRLWPGPETVMEQARAAFNRNDFRPAETLFRRVVQMSPGHSGLRNEAGLFYATCFVREKNYRQGEAEFRKFLAEYPTSFWSPEASFNLAECESALGRPAEAARLYRQIIAAFPTTSWAEYSQDRLKR